VLMSATTGVAEVPQVPETHNRVQHQLFRRSQDMPFASGFLGRAMNSVTRSNSENPEGWVFDIERFAVHDGPGVRTTVFLKGCTLRCVWCHNPESLSPRPELLVYPRRCIGCNGCVEVCPRGARRLTATGERTLDRQLCDLCGRCVEACYAGAMKMAGRKLSVDEVMAVLRQDAAFYETSGGGVTLSGGEPMMQGEFATALLRRCKGDGYRTALDTCGHVGWSVLQGALPYVDLVLYDLKHISARLHRRQAGASNRLILSNLRRIVEFGTPVEVRMPIVPTINDSKEFIDAAAEFLASLSEITAVRLLGYHRLAGPKYLALGRENTMPDVPSPAAEQMRQIAAWLERRGLRVILPPERGLP